MSENEAQEPATAKKGPAPSAIKLVKVKFVFSKRLAELTLAVPKKTTKADLVEILAEIDHTYTFDDFHGEHDPDDSISLLEYETVEGDEAEANFVATHSVHRQWTVEEVAAQ